MAVASCSKAERADYDVQKRVTTAFSIAYGTYGALSGIPVAAVYQPNWWFKVELQLDENQDVPPDPAADVSLSRRIATLCSSIPE